MRRVILGDNLKVLASLPAAFARLAYIDPPFNTGKAQSRTRIKTTSDANGDRTGFGGKRFRTETLGTTAYADTFDDYQGFLIPRVEAALRCLTADASLFVHLDDREVWSTKVALDRLLGPECFVQSIIWAYDFGGRPKNRYPAKHDIILWYVLDPSNYVYNYSEVERIPYMAPGLVGPEKAALGKAISAVWWHTICPTQGKERTGYPTQKPLGILNRIVKVHSNPGDVVLDWFGGSGTAAEAAALNGRGFVAIDSNPQAYEVMMKRLTPYGAEGTEGSTENTNAL